MDWFNFYQSIKVKYIIFDKNIYNIDKNGYMMGIIESTKEVFLKYQNKYL